jgi:hypothetical protein
LQILRQWALTSSVIQRSFPPNELKSLPADFSGELLKVDTAFDATTCSFAVYFTPHQLQSPVTPTYSEAMPAMPPSASLSSLFPEDVRFGLSTDPLETAGIALAQLGMELDHFGMTTNEMELDMPEPMEMDQQQASNIGPNDSHQPNLIAAEEPTFFCVTIGRNAECKVQPGFHPPVLPSRTTAKDGNPDSSESTTGKVSKAPPDFMGLVTKVWDFGHNLDFLVEAVDYLLLKHKPVD